MCWCACVRVWLLQGLLAPGSPQPRPAAAAAANNIAPHRLEQAPRLALARHEEGGSRRGEEKKSP